MRMSLLALACATLLLAACSSSNSGTPADADDDLATSVPTATTTEADAGDTADSATSEPTNDGGGDETVATLRYIGNTGGSGVAVRDACAQNARAGGAWPDATEVVVLEVGSGGCDGWSFVSRDGTALESWVSNTYLVDTRPVTTVSRPPASTSTPPPSTSTPTSTPPTPAPTQPPTPVTYPPLSMSPNPVNFGEIPPGDVSARSVLLSNTSPNAVTITSVVFANGSHDSGAFSVTSNCDGQTVASGVACRIVARFTPSTGGQYSATVYISTNSASAPVALTLLGVGYVPN
jgi:hypothetical protein